MNLVKSGIFFISMIMLETLVSGCHSKEYPIEVGYYELMGIDRNDIDEIKIIYEPQGLPEQFDPYIDRTIKKTDQRTQDEFTEILDYFDRKLQILKDVDISEQSPPYIQSELQVVFSAQGQEYTLPMIEIFKWSKMMFITGTWVLYDDSCVYQVMDLPGIVPGFPIGLSSNLAYYTVSARPDKSKHRGPELPDIELKPELRSMLIDPIGNEGIESLEQMLESSIYIFKGEIIERQSAVYEEEILQGEQYTIQVEESFYGSYVDGQLIQMSALNGGYDDINQIYSTRINVSERALREDKEYIFCLDVDKQGEGRITNFLYGITEVIDGQIWPIFNAEPSSAWVYGMSLNDFKAKVSAVKQE